MKKSFCLELMLILLVALVASAGEKIVDPGSKYLLLSTVKTTTMQKELDEATALGFRVVTASALAGQEMAILMERIPQGEEKYTYKLLATTNSDTMERELNTAAKEGYRLLSRTMMAKEGFLSKEIVVLLERNPNQKGNEYEYKVLATSRTGTLQKEMTQAAKDGFVVSGFGSRGEHMAIMEREKAPSTGTPVQP